jgi:hypothetical protein
MQDRDAFHAAHERAYRVLDPDHRQPELVAHAPDELRGGVDLGLGEPCRDFVEQQDVGARPERHADFQQARPRGCERPGRDVDDGAEADEAQDRARVAEGVVRMAAAPARELEPEPDVFAGGHAAEHPRGLERARDAV